jgi:hypothetical protein
MTQRNDKEFLELYQIHRYKDQLQFYKDRRGEFTKAQTQAISISIGLIFLAAIAGVFESTDVSWLKIVCLLLAAICPVFATTLAAYSTLYGFEQQAKLYQDTINNLQRARVLEPDVQQGLSDADFAEQVNKYVHEVEHTFLVEQGQWGQLARKMKPSEP